MKAARYLMPLGMISVITYFIHVFLGQLLWPEYNPVTMDISSLTADGAPNAGLLRIFTLIYGLCFMLFAVGMAIKAFKLYHAPSRVGYAVFLAMAVISFLGYGFFPLAEDKTAMSFQNVMHLAVSGAVVLTTLLSLYLTAFGYLKKEKLKLLGGASLAAAVLITVFGPMTPIGMANGWNILGVTERMVIFTLQLFVFFLSFVHTFKPKLAGV